MNFAGHILLVAFDADDRTSAPTDTELIAEPDFNSPELLLGAALPDFASMGRFRLQRPATNTTIERGIAHHHRVDGAFHHHPWFTERNARLADQFEERHLSRGAARACAHVGVELMLDGSLFSLHPKLLPTTNRCLASLTESSLSLSEMVESDKRSAWQGHLERLANWTLQESYGEPSEVARRLHRIVSGRPRLAFDQSSVNTVSEVLTSAKADIDETVEAFIKQLRLELADDDIADA